MSLTKMTNVWEQERFNNLYIFASEGGTPSTFVEEYYKNGKIPFVKIEDTLKKYIYSTKNFITELGLNKSSAWIIKKDNIIFTNGATVGNISINKIDLSTKQGILGIILKENFNVEFIYYLLNTINFKNKINQIKTKGTFDILTLNNIDTIKINIINNKNEQLKISNLLSKIDSLITLHQRELKILKIFKKSLFVKMIVGKNLTILPSSLTKMTNVWEQERLGNLLDVSKIKNISNFFTRSDVFSVSKDFGVINQIEFLGRSFAGKHLKNYKILKTGQLVYTKSPLSNNPYGIIKCNNNIDGIVSSLYAVYQPKENVNPFFIAHFYSIDYRVNNLLKPLIAKGAKNTMNITDEAILGAMFRVPLINEQNKIAVIFSNINSLITFISVS
ncbi:restriction endonuclease subunit S [Mycoplasmopsis cynos]|uniref:restriction endonuclease subunit S n=1 Tax=Mycoplasmopsis cynos TaxID=171284 RepID=UPI002AFF670B|nr:restriction endonuclease subunit S [Mycoplasmopsis cynos]WQQ16017.1 restriction endonuclease subunit S [Mycoplasmopsis cynos]